MANADKRKVSTDALETLGTIITEKERRDAIHLAVENVQAAHDLVPGQDVGFIGDPRLRQAGKCQEPLGIVDPFLNKGPRKGEWFWLVVYPRQISSLRHVWSHPKFPDPPEILAFTEEEEKKIKQTIGALDGASKKWLENFAHSIGVTYEDLIDHARRYNEYGEYWNEGGRFEGVSCDEEFWKHYHGVTGEELSSECTSKWGGNFFSCSC